MSPLMANSKDRHARSQGQIFLKNWSNVKVKRLCTNRKILHIHVKYQSFRTHCLKVISNCKVSDRFTEKQNDKKRNDKITDTCEYKFLFKKNKLTFQKFFFMKV